VSPLDMRSGKSDVTGEELGMRTFQLRKSRAVERAMERLRQGMGPEYASLSTGEIQMLGWVFGELWAYDSREDWNDLHFSHLDAEDVRAIIGYGREITDHSRNSVEILADVRAVIVAKG
jgi:hypothetical protein